MTRQRLLTLLRFVAALPGRALLFLLRGYQLFISPMTGPTCRYYPSCSQYAVVAVQRHGAIRGSLLAGWRLLRCNPWSAGGIDDVPPARPHKHSLTHVVTPTS